LISDGVARQACRERTRTLAQTFTWEATLQGLLAFCRRPYVMSENTPPADGAAPEPDGNAERNAALSRLDHLWRLQPQNLTSVLPLLSQAKQAASTVMRWYMQPVIDQQNRFNAAVVQALHQMAESHDHQQSMMSHQQSIMSHHFYTLLSQNIHALLAEYIHKLLAQTTNVTTHLQSLQTQVDRLSDQVDQTNDLTRTQIDNIIQHLASLQQQVDTIESNVQRLVEATEPLHHHLADIEVHLCDIDDVQTRLAHALVTPEDSAESAS
jgi:hypothetical protein